MCELASVAPTVPWGLNPVAVGAIASSVSAVITATALIIAVRTYLHNSRAAARSQASLVTARATISEPVRAIDGVEYWPTEIRITNTSDADIFDLSLLLHSKRTGRGYLAKDIRLKLNDDINLKWSRRRMSSGPLTRAMGIWEVEDGAIIPPGASTLSVYLDGDQLWSRIGVGFSDRNGRKWVKWVDGELVEGSKTGWKIMR